MNHNSETAHDAAAASADALSPEQRQRDAEQMLRGIAWLSIAIGAAELLAPRRTRQAVSVGIGGWWMRLRGLRSIGGGIALLVSDDKQRWLHRRSLANALDVLALARDHDGGAAARARNAAAIAAIGGLTAADLTAARMMRPQAQIDGPASDPRLSRG